MVEGIEQFNDIRPYEPEEMKQAFNDLLNDRQFSLIMKGFAPWLPKFLRNGLLRLAFTGVKSPLDFQKRFMKPVVNYIIRKHTDGCTFDDKALKPQISNLKPDTPSSATIGISCLILPSSICCCLSMATLQR